MNEDELGLLNNKPRDAMRSVGWMETIQQFVQVYSFQFFVAGFIWLLVITTVVALKTKDLHPQSTPIWKNALRSDDSILIAEDVPKPSTATGNNTSALNDQIVLPNGIGAIIRWPQWNNFTRNTSRECNSLYRAPAPVPVNTTAPILPSIVQGRHTNTISPTIEFVMDRKLGVPQGNTGIRMKFHCGSTIEPNNKTVTSCGKSITGLEVNCTGGYLNVPELFVNGVGLLATIQNATSVSQSSDSYLLTLNPAQCDIAPGTVRHYSGVSDFCERIVVRDDVDVISVSTPPAYKMNGLTIATKYNSDISPMVSTYTYNALAPLYNASNFGPVLRYGSTSDVDAIVQEANYEFRVELNLNNEPAEWYQLPGFGPTTKFAVSGFMTYVNSLVYAGGISYYSDVRNKTAIRECSITRSLEVLDCIEVLRYNYTGVMSHIRPGRRDGFSAQQFGKCLPNGVQVTDKGQYTLDTTELIPHLVNGYKYSKKSISQMRAEIDTLKQQNAFLINLMRNVYLQLNLELPVGLNATTTTTPSSS